MKKLYLIFTLLLISIAGFGQASTITSFSPATGPVGTLVTINCTNLTSPTALTIGGQTAIAISNTGSVLVAMVMPNTTTGAISITTTSGTATGSGNFTVTATPYPLAQQGSKLVGTGNIGAAYQGRSVSISADGNTAIVGADNDYSNQGAARVYTRSGSSRTFTTRTYDYFKLTINS